MWSNSKLLSQSGTHYAELAGPRLIETHLALPPECGITPGPWSLTLALISSLDVVLVLLTGQQAFLGPINLQEDY